MVTRLKNRNSKKKWNMEFRHCVPINIIDWVGSEGHENPSPEPGLLPEARKKMDIIKHFPLEPV